VIQRRTDDSLETEQACTQSIQVFQQRRVARAVHPDLSPDGIFVGTCFTAMIVASGRRRERARKISLNRRFILFMRTRSIKNPDLSYSCALPRLARQLLDSNQDLLPAPAGVDSANIIPARAEMEVECMKDFPRNNARGVRKQAGKRRW
jgi:hypothetical protein